MSHKFYYARKYSLLPLGAQTEVPAFPPATLTGFSIDLIPEDSQGRIGPKVVKPAVWRACCLSSLARPERGVEALEAGFDDGRRVVGNRLALGRDGEPGAGDQKLGRAEFRGGQRSKTPANRDDDEFTRRVRLTWAKLIRRVYEVDPLLCPFCGAEMKILAFILDFAAAKGIRKSLKLPAQEPEPLAHAPPETLEFIAESA